MTADEMSPKETREKLGGGATLGVQSQAASYTARAVGGEDNVYVVVGRHESGETSAFAAPSIPHLFQMMEQIANLEVWEIHES